MGDTAVVVSSDATVFLFSCSSSNAVCCVETTGSHLGMVMGRELGSGLKSSL